MANEELEQQHIADISAKLTQQEGTLRQFSDDAYVNSLNIDAKTPPLGQAAMAGSVPVVIASDQSPVPITGSITATNDSVGLNGAVIPTSSTLVAGSDGTNLIPLSVDGTGKLNVLGSFTIPAGASTAANQATEITSLSSIDGKLNSLGQKTMAASVPVVIASNQSAIPVTGVGTSLNNNPTPTSSVLMGASDGTNLRAVSVDSTGKLNINNISGVVSLPTGASTETTLSAINGKTPSLGQALMAASVPVVISSNQSALPVTFSGGTAGDVASDAVDSGNPVKVGGQARTTNITAVANADRVNATFDKLGRIVTTPVNVREMINHDYAVITTTTETSIVSSFAEKTDLSMLIIANTSATGVTIDIRDVATGVVRLSVYSPPTSTLDFSFPIPIPGTTAASNWTAEASAAVTDLRITTVSVRNA